MSNRSAFVSAYQSNVSQRESMQSITSKIPSLQDSTEDAQYLLVRKQILDSPYLQKVNQHLRIRLLNWISRLDRIKTNKVWIANRNNYIKLLNLMCHCQYITFPFSQLPPQRDLLNLRKHDITKIIDQIEREVKTSRPHSRRASIVEPQCLKTQSTTTNFHSEMKRFKTEENTCGQEDNDTIPMRNFGGVRTFQTDFQDKTISFNLSTDNQLMSNHLSNFEGDQADYQCNNIETKKFRSQSKKTVLDNLEFVRNKIVKEERSPQKMTRNIPLKRPPLCRPHKNQPLKKQNRSTNIREKENKKEYWQSNEITGNNSGVGTPKYLDKCQWNDNKVIKEVEIVSHRDGQGQGCDCTSKVLGQNWFSQFLKKIIS